MGQEFQERLIRLLEKSMPSEFVFSSSCSDVETVRESVKQLFESGPAASELPGCNHFISTSTTV